MSYLHISSLYKDQRLLAFRKVYALEKVHGTSAHIGCRFPHTGTGKNIYYFSGGASDPTFRTLFNEPDLIERFTTLGHPHVVVYGEAYGGKMQGMSATYGKELRFIAFEVKIASTDSEGHQHETWLSVPNAADVCEKLGLEFVPYELIDCTVANLDQERDRPSRVAVLRGIEGDRVSEGIVIRPPFEVRASNGERLIAKHKGADFGETRSPRPVVDAAVQVVLDDAAAIASEWVTPMRLAHVLDRLGDDLQMSDIPRVITAMQEDVLREGAGEIVVTPTALKAIGRETVKLFSAGIKARVKDSL